MMVRPIRPTDEPKLADLFYSLSDDTLYRRFMRLIKRMTRRCAVTGSPAAAQRRSSSAMQALGSSGESVDTQLDAGKRSGVREGPRRKETVPSTWASRLRKVSS